SALLDPSLQLANSAGQIIAANDNWMDDPDQAEAIMQSGLAPSDPRESAIIGSLAPGAYTAIVNGVDGTQNIALVEVYDLDSTNGTQLLNISTRAFVDSDDGVMIAGFIIGGTNSETVVIRGLGPSLANGISPVTDPLADPVLTLVDANGTTLAANQNWQDTQADDIIAAGLALPNELESAILITLPPGNYTAILFDANGGTGVALIEVYNITGNQ
ncbi:MAG: hypothetical protein ACRD5Z_13055, partial [Bryobacteraceae bacterium]